MVCVSVIHANKVAAKLQAVLQPNPKKARPSCRKEQKRLKACKEEPAGIEKVAKVKVEKNVKPVPAALAPNREVWEVDSDDSDLEVLVVRQLKPMASLPEVPAVSWMHANNKLTRLSNLYNVDGYGIAKACDEERSWQLLQASQPALNVPAWAKAFSSRWPGSIRAMSSFGASTKMRDTTLVCMCPSWKVCRAA